MSTPSISTPFVPAEQRRAAALWAVMTADERRQAILNARVAAWMREVGYV